MKFFTAFLLLLLAAACVAEHEKRAVDWQKVHEASPEMHAALLEYQRVQEERIDLFVKLLFTLAAEDRAEYVEMVQKQTKETEKTNWILEFVSGLKINK